MARALAVAERGEVSEADIVDLAQDGRGIARIEGKTVFVAGALPGERVRLRLLKRRRRMDEAAVAEVLSASPDRVVPRCAHFGVCGGCALQHLSPDAQLAAKQRQLLEALTRIGRVAPQRILAPLRGPAWAYRRRARLGIKYVHKKGRVLAGFRERDKPYIADIKRCEILVEHLALLPQELAALTETLAIAKQLPQVELAAGDSATALVFRVLAEPPADDIEKLARFGAQRGLQIFLQSGGPGSVRPLRGGAEAPLSYALDEGRIVIEFAPLDFIQVNAPVNAAMLKAALQLLGASAADRVLDLFCGVGNFTLPIARRAGAVCGVEGDAPLLQKARANAARNRLGNVQFEQADLFMPPSFGEWAKQRYDLVLLDPPRAGAAELLTCMRQWRPRRVVYISCHPGSLARDAGILVNELQFTLTAAGVMDMFPHTTHVESIAVFEHAP